MKSEVKSQEKKNINPSFKFMQGLDWEKIILLRYGWVKKMFSISFILGWVGPNISWNVSNNVQHVCKYINFTNKMGWVEIQK